MKNLNILFIIFLILVFFIGMYIYSISFKTTHKKEGLENQEPDNSNSCPDLLINKGDAILLYNSKLPLEEGINPIPFFTLDDYINYLEIQRKKGINCPVLYLQQENNAQGQDVYRIRPSPFDQQGGLPFVLPHNGPYPELPAGLPPGSYLETTSNSNIHDPVPIADASRDNPPYNANNYPGFDPQGLYVGVYTTIDRVHDSTSYAPVSDNPMDTNWGGVMHTQKQVDSGKYDENTVLIRAA